MSDPLAPAPASCDMPSRQPPSPVACHHQAALGALSARRVMCRPLLAFPCRHQGWVKCVGFTTSTTPTRAALTPPGLPNPWLQKRPETVPMRALEWQPGEGDGGSASSPRSFFSQTWLRAGVTPGASPAGCGPHSTARDRAGLWGLGSPPGCLVREAQSLGVSPPSPANSWLW